MRANFAQLIEAIQVQMQPPPRAIATANTLQQLSMYMPNDVTLADLVVGWQTLAHVAKQGEEPATTQRRVTCSELASIASQFTIGQGSRTQAIKAWEQWAKAFEHSYDPRQKTMAKTFARELAELQAAVQLSGGEQAPPCAQAPQVEEDTQQET